MLTKRMKIHISPWLQGHINTKMLKRNSPVSFKLALDFTSFDEMEWKSKLDYALREVVKEQPKWRDQKDPRMFKNQGGTTYLRREP